MKSLKEGSFNGKRVLVRCDFNIGMDDSGKITDDFRIVKALPTIKYLVKSGAVVVLMSHLEKKERVISLEAVAYRLEKLLNESVEFLDDCVGDKVEQVVKKGHPGEIFLLENLRFHKEEKMNDDVFAQKLARLGDYYVNEAFSCSHRAHASIASVPHYLPSFAGLLLEEEISNLSRVTNDPAHPFVVVIGGSKVETKSKMIVNISKVADHILIGSKIGEDILIQKQQLMGRPAVKRDPAVDAIDLTSPRVHMPIDGVLALKDLSEGYSRTAAIGKMRNEEDIYDIGPETIKFFVEIIREAKTIFFNGPVGLFERQEFSNGTRSLLEAISRAHNAYRVAGGGETIEAIHKFSAEKMFNFISTGGGAMLDYLSGNVLPGVAALERSYHPVQAAKPLGTPAPKPTPMPVPKPEKQ